MKSYTLRFNSGFYSDLIESFDWGVEYWGEDAAINWSEQIESKIETTLSRSPLGCSIAPESDLIPDSEIRQLVIGRYRILFTVQQSEVFILHLRGSFNSGRG